MARNITNNVFAQRLSQVTGITVSEEMFTIWMNNGYGEKTPDVDRAVAILLPRGLKQQLEGRVRDAVRFALGSGERFSRGVDLAKLVNVNWP